MTRDDRNFGTSLDRRRVLQASGLLAVGSIAGCSAASNEAGESSPAETPSPTATVTPSASGSGGPPGADQLGGPDDLKSDVSIRATVLDSDRGAGRFVNTPAVVWIESGTTVEWQIEGAAHSVTAYHPDNDRPLRIPEGAASFDSGTLSSGKTFTHTFETQGVYNYFCRPHESLGMVGLVIVDSPAGGPGTTNPSEVSGKAASKLQRLLGEVAGVLGGGDTKSATYGWQAATWDSYWYSLYNMSTTIAMSGNGITFPATKAQKKVFSKRFPAMLKAADRKKPPIANPNLNMAPFTEGDPHFTEKPVFDVGDGRPDASTLSWDASKSSKVVSPASVAWTHLKGVTWAKNFQNHFETLPDSIAPRFRSMVLSTLAQLGVKFSIAEGNLRANDENVLLVSGFNPKKGVVAQGPDPTQHAAMLWFLSDLVSLATGGWFGYQNPTPLIPAGKLQTMADGLAKTTMNAFGPEDWETTRDVGLALGALGWYGTHAGSEKLASAAASYANELADEIDARMDDNGHVSGGAPNQAATQGIVAQGLTWASRIDGVDRTDDASAAVGYLLDTLWDGEAETFATGTDDETYTITARDAGDITGGLNAAEAVLDESGVRERYARFFDATFNRGRLQRAERPPSHDPEAANPLPLPPKAGGEYGQAAVYNAAVEYDPGGGGWRVSDDTFDTEAALYLANQDIWISHWGGEFFHGRGVPGESDEPV